MCYFSIFTLWYGIELNPSSLLTPLDAEGARAPSIRVSVRRVNQRLACVSCGTAPACSVNTTGPERTRR